MVSLCVAARGCGTIVLAHTAWRPSALRLLRTLPTATVETRLAQGAVARTYWSTRRGHRERWPCVHGNLRRRDVCLGRGHRRGAVDFENGPAHRSFTDGREWRALFRFHESEALRGGGAERETPLDLRVRGRHLEFAHRCEQSCALRRTRRNFLCRRCCDRKVEVEASN